MNLTRSITLVGMMALGNLVLAADQPIFDPSKTYLTCSDNGGTIPRDLGFHQYGYTEILGPSGYGTLYYVTQVLSAPGPQETKEAQDLISAGWILINHCTQPFIYWEQFLAQSGGYFPSLLAKAVPLGTGPKNNGEMCPRIGNPINPATGNKFQKEKDIASQGISPIEFIRYYNSSTSFATTELGFGWSHTYARSLTDLRPNGSASVSILRSDGKIYPYKSIGGQWKSDDDVVVQLTEQLDTNQQLLGWQLIGTDNIVEEYDAEGKLSSIKDITGNMQTLFYDANNRLERVETNTGNYLEFGYDVQDRIITITLDTGYAWQYRYDVNSNLEFVDNPDNTSKQYHYEDLRFPHALTGITDENGNRYATWTYDDQGRAISSEHANGVDKHSLAFNADGTTTVTNPLGKQTTYHFTDILGVKKVTQVEGHPTASCAGANKAYTYDANGFMTSKTDWQGHLTTYTRDSRGLELSRTEAAGTPEARTITTEWHTDYRLPVRITEPGKITEFTYDAQGRELSRSVRPQL